MKKTLRSPQEIIGYLSSAVSDHYEIVFTGSDEPGFSTKAVPKTKLIKDEKGKYIGSLTVKEKESGTATVREVFEVMLKRGETQNNIGKEIDELVALRIEEIWAKYKRDDRKLRKAEKIAFMREIFASGLHNVRGAMSQIAEITGISQASLYRYLVEVIEE